MDDRLIFSIAQRDPLVAYIFEKGFQSPEGWRRYLNQNLPMGASFTLEKLGFTYGSARDFQALYVACWIYRPVEKGSYMIPLRADQAERVGHAIEGLPTRWSSHLSEKNARSAGQGYEFLKGYRELLVQLEVDPGTKACNLFLKTEGHDAMSIAHIKSFFAKLGGGEGLTQSEALNKVAIVPADDPFSLGVERRAAENYSKTYEALLKNVGLTGNLVDAETAIFAICEKLAKKASLEGEGIFKMVKIKRWEKKLTNVDLASLVEQVILPTIGKASTAVGKHLSAVRGSEHDLRRLASNLRRDYSEEQKYVPRFFEEVRVTGAQLDGELNRFKATLTELQNTRP